MHLLRVSAEDDMNSQPMKTPKEVAEALAGSEFTVYRLIQSGHIKAVKAGRQWRTPAEEADRAARTRRERQHVE